jgi:hypothetical protein
VARKRKTNYPPPKSSKRTAPAGSEESPERPNLATINLTAGAGQAGLKVGDRVRIQASGIYAGEVAIIEKISAGGVIPSALVRTEGGGTRQVRTIDLVPAKAEPKPEPAPTPEAEAPSPN